MSKRCVFYLRVSTDIQDNERQKIDLEEFAKANSFIYDKDDVYEDKLSGFKGAQERPELARMLNDVVQKKIEVVLVWEISRLSRNQTELHQITDFFSEHSINIYFYQQSFWLLDKLTNEVNKTAGLFISFFGWNAEFEAKLTKDRFHSGKKRYVKEGKYNGGNITFGYTIGKFGKTDNDNDKKFIIKNDLIEGLKVSEADIVREVFDLYESGLTCSKICLYSKSKGYPKKVCSPHTLSRLLRNTSYIGYKDVKLGKRPTPPIIDEAQFERVGHLIDTNKTKADKGKKHTYLLRGVLKCSYCGRFYLGKQTDDAYMCSLNSQTNKFIHHTSCKAGNISISNIDGIIWERIKDIWINKKLHGFEDVFESTKKEIDEFKTEIEDYKKLLIEIDKKRVKTNRIYQNDGYTAEEYDKEFSKIKKDTNNCKLKIKELQVKIRNNEKIKEDADKVINRKKRIESISDRKQMQTIIKSYIKDITFYKDKVSLFKTVLFVLYQGGKTEIILYNSVSKKGDKFKLFNSKCLTYNKSNNSFNLLKKQFHSIFKTSITIQEFASQKLKHKFFDKPNDNNSDVYDFDSLIKLSDIPNIVETKEYTKITYFKDLNTKRFNRKR